jgi:hypothetical protein
MIVIYKGYPASESRHCDFTQVVHDDHISTRHRLSQSCMIMLRRDIGFVRVREFIEDSFK